MNMGLDITAYSHLRVLNDHEHSETCWERGHIYAFAYASFPHSYRGLEFGKQQGLPAFIGGRCYVETGETRVHGFRAGSYSGYNAFRAALMEHSGTGFDSKPDEPFYELINFADNEGCIGPDAAKDLLVDFQTHAVAFKEAFPDWASKYDEWVTAFELAAEDGMVQFY